MLSKVQQNQVVLVNDSDEELGVMDKLAAHEEGVLHRAFSVFVFNRRGELLIHQRALDKYHSGGLWTNTCCSHPGPGERVKNAAQRRLLEEMGFTTPLVKAFDFVYRAEFGNGLIEHEFDHVFIGHADVDPNPVPEEVADWKYVSRRNLKLWMEQSPEDFTAWFRLSVDYVYEWLEESEPEKKLTFVRA
ncbi:MAG: hypothetical protein RL220_946 [Bacteroidota bacterium]|jgi:isopentenyl-diphosphate delta-isomerase